MQEFSDWLRNELIERDWAQADLAERSSVPNATEMELIADKIDELKENPDIEDNVKNIISSRPKAYQFINEGRDWIIEFSTLHDLE